MIERGSGRTSGLTDWRLMDVASMWACLQDHDTTNHWKQVAGWRKVCELARAHLSRLQEYRKGLAEAWPPETNEAARAYVRELDELIDKVQRTHDAASANYTALSAATQAISATRAELKKIYETYAVKVQEKRTYEATLADPKAAMGSRVPDRPVTDADLERLNVQARGIMYGLSGELQHAQVMLQKPPAVRPPRPDIDTDAADAYGGGIAPAIPPIVPISVASPSGTSSANKTSAPIRAVQTPTAPSTGPVLGGAGTGLAPAKPTPGIPTTTPLTPQNSPPVVGGLPSLPPGTGQPSVTNPQRSPLGRPGPGGIGNQATPTQPSPSRSMPPGGLIGGAPGIGLGQPAASNNQPRRINPIGGVIGGGAGTAPTGGAGSRPGGGRGIGAGHNMPPFGGGPFGGTTGVDTRNGISGRPGPLTQRSAGDARHWDPDHPWDTDQGVPPVVHPPKEEGPIDPGPAIGFNR
ncbi:hypothetical protein GA0070606_2383 [Micromonospora citrea]|uniref:PPE family protein n=1 Tax=Micromonospora citrea TaxID=47855 RepID=A0A1C6UMC1_9ACTN|nr:hypothetical protein [Micromonospora citrea]SCL55053.1 hypothetical protein GA0070606_2383 [Micromonospora citrea]